MTLQELEDHEIFLPEAERGELDLHTSVHVPALVGAFVLGAVSCVLMVAGGGALWTWIGAVLFVLFMILFALVSNAGIERQNARIERLHAAHASEEETREDQRGDSGSPRP